MGCQRFASAEDHITSSHIVQLGSVAEEGFDLINVLNVLYKMFYGLGVISGKSNLDKFLVLVTAGPDSHPHECQSAL